MSIRFIALVASLSLIAHVDIANADRADARQELQAKRIEAGEASGQLTAKEAKRLKKRQAHVNNIEAAAEADGELTRKEKVRIEAAQDRNSAAIARKKHNKRKKN